jgi:hypothetical protein
VRQFKKITNQKLDNCHLSSASNLFTVHIQITINFALKCDVPSRQTTGLVALASIGSNKSKTIDLEDLRRDGQCSARSHERSRYLMCYAKDEDDENYRHGDDPKLRRLFATSVK